MTFRFSMKVADLPKRLLLLHIPDVLESRKGGFWSGSATDPFLMKAILVYRQL
ncbi:hypothetical protein WAI453_002398 [Rhynchosporium graminicola]